MRSTRSLFLSLDPTICSSKLALLASVIQSKAHWLLNHYRNDADADFDAVTKSGKASMNLKDLLSLPMNLLGPLLPWAPKRKKNGRWGTESALYYSSTLATTVSGVTHSMMYDSARTKKPPGKELMVRVVYYNLRPYSKTPRGAFLRHVLTLLPICS